MGERHVIATGIAVLVLAAVHLYSGRAKKALDISYFGSFAAGLALAYVFMHVLPELAEYQKALLGILRHPLLRWFKEQVYLFALLGVLSFYVLRSAAERESAVPGGAGTAFRLDMLAASLHAALSGYVFAHQGTLGWPLFLITSAFGAHYFSSDIELLERHGDRYRQTGAKVLAAVIVAGWIAGQLQPLPREAVTAIYAYVSGGIIMYSLHEELPHERRGNIAALCLGAALYTGLILWIYYFADR